MFYSNLVGILQPRSQSHGDTAIAALPKDGGHHNKWQELHQAERVCRPQSAYVDALCSLPHVCLLQTNSQGHPDHDPGHVPTGHCCLLLRRFELDLSMKQRGLNV